MKSRKNEPSLVFSVICCYFGKTYSASGCPIAARNKMRILESGGTIEQHKAAIAAVTAAAIKYDENNRLVSATCEDINHINDSYSAHRYSLQGIVLLPLTYLLSNLLEFHVSSYSLFSIPSLISTADFQIQRWWWWLPIDAHDHQKGKIQ